MKFDTTPWRGSRYIWFKLNAVLALLPPVHWAVTAYSRPILGLGATLIYFLVLCTSIALSVIFTFMHQSGYRGKK